METALIILLVILVVATIGFLVSYIKQKVKVLSDIAKDFNSSDPVWSKETNASIYRKVKEEMISVIVGLIVVIAVVIGGAIYLCF